MISDNLEDLRIELLNEQSSSEELSRVLEVLRKFISVGSSYQISNIAQQGVLSKLTDLLCELTGDKDLLMECIEIILKTDFEDSFIVNMIDVKSLIEWSETHQRVNLVGLLRRHVMMYFSESVVGGERSLDTLDFTDAAAVWRSIEVDVLRVNSFGETALFFAVQEAGVGAVSAMLDRGANVLHLDSRGNSVLMTACLRESVEIVNSLIERGADLHVANKEGQTALMIASRRRFVDIVKLLMDNGATVSAYKQRDTDDLSPIRLINFEDFKKLSEFPRFPENRDICVNKEDVDRQSSLIIFLSHCWLRGWSGAVGWDGRPHPDNSSHEKHSLSVSGIEKIKKMFAPGMTSCYIWLDFGCINQDGNPAGELKQLDEIVRYSDCLFTPLAGEGLIPNTYNDIYEDYRADTWNADKYGYVNRGWCRIEMFFAANIPAVNDSQRVEKFSQGLKTFVSKGVRPHFLYGRNNKFLGSPLLIPPMQNSYFDKYHPSQGEISMPQDKDKIEELVQQLVPYMASAKCGYEGDLVGGKQHGKGKYVYNDGSVYRGDWAEDKFHGKGVFTYSSGNVYEGDWVDHKRNGKGKFSYSDGSVYEGEWMGDMFHGKGAFTFSDGDVYEGEYQENKKHGTGRFTFSDGDIYEGEWAENKKHGKGQFQWRSGDYFKGDFVNNKMHGGELFLARSGVAYAAVFSQTADDEVIFIDGSQAFLYKVKLTLVNDVGGEVCFYDGRFANGRCLDL